ncbi:MAG: nickel pincer cofactor biosynthesis protein LarC [Candidatus Omnitrophica bacterium]|nr:nickel pincer cofactor biosynthesis protein LarC [Candidatus Omnitrophota bacterium]
MKIAYFDCFSGASGDMILGALLDAGLDIKVLKKEIAKLPLKGYSIQSRRKKANGIAGTKLFIKASAKQPHRTLKTIREIIQKSGISTTAKELSLKVFKDLAKAEGKIHGVKPEKVFFHEVGAIDSILDIVGSVIALELLGVKKVYASRIPLGSGFVKCRHGKIPVPAPATVAILKHVPVYDSGVKAELTTPTGAAILKNVCVEFGLMPDMEIEATGYGAGSRELEIPNFLRVTIGQGNNKGYQKDRVCQIETNIDDMNPELFEYVGERLQEEGALDVFMTPVYMKKNRPGTLLTVISPHDLQNSLVDIIFNETTTLGVRMMEVTRKKLDREEIAIKTDYGSVMVKVCRIKGRVVNMAPEYESCKKMAKKKNVPLKLIYESSLQCVRAALEN